MLIAKQNIVGVLYPDMFPLVLKSVKVRFPPTAKLI